MRYLASVGLMGMHVFEETQASLHIGTVSPGIPQDTSCSPPGHPKTNLSTHFCNVYHIFN